MKQDDKGKFGRRDFLRAVGAGAGLAVTAAAPLATEAQAAESPSEERKARYKADSEDVKNFYRVNSYPKK
ncbi:MAG: twin-arginine translocation signal domain-containing protein [Pseudolabrys sp.]